MVDISTPPGLEGLFDLDRKGVDIRPTLLRVLTDQYLRTSVHTPDEERHYTKLAMRLIDETDIATRAAVAARLAPHACAPRAIMLQLARDVIEVAEPVLLHSPCLTPADCEVISRERGASYAEMIARREWPAADPAPPAPAEPVAAPETDADATVAASDDDANARELCELFFAASSAERRLILLGLDYADWPADEPVVALQRADIWRLETAALRHHTATLERELERALGISHRQSRRIVEDELGEPIVVAGKAMNLPGDVVQRIVLIMNPRVGQSVDRVFELASLYNEISVDAARRLFAILRAAEPAAPRTISDSRAIYEAAETARQALSDLASTLSRKSAAAQRRTAGGRES